MRGYARQEFHMSARSGGGNEPLDCLAYALAVASITKAPTKSAKPKSTIGDLAAKLNATSNTGASSNEP